MNTFLSALKQKSADIQASIENRSVDRPVGTLFTEPAPMQNYDPNPIQVRIERVLTRNRLDILFSAKPGEEIRTALTDQGFKYDGERKAWYHRDTLLNRAFVAKRFNAPELLTPEDTAPEAPVTPVNPSCEVISDTLEESTSKDYERFKSQVRALQAELQLDAADLMLQAIEALYTQTFKVN